MTPARERRILTLATLGIVGVGSYASFAIPVLAGVLQERFSLSDSGLGLVLSANMVGGVAGGLVGGVLADRLGRRRTLRSLAWLAAVGWLLCGLGGLPILMAGLAIGGFGFSGALTAGSALLSGLYPDRRRASYSTILVTSALAGIVLPPAIAVLRSGVRAGDIRFELAVGGPFALVALVVATLAWLAGTARSSHERSRASDATTAMRGPVVAGIALIVALAACHSAADTTLYSWMPRFLTTTFTSHSFDPAIVLSLYSAVYLIGRLALSAMPDTVATNALLIAPGILGGTLALLSVHASTFAGAAWLYVAASAMYGLEFPSLMGLAARRYPDRFGTVCGLVSAANLVAAVGVWGVGKATEITGSMRPGMSAACLGFIVFGLGCALWLRLNNRATSAVSKECGDEGE